MVVLEIYKKNLSNTQKFKEEISFIYTQFRCQPISYPMHAKKLSNRVCIITKATKKRILSLEC